MKKLLIIQQDDEYFLYETLQVLEENSNFLKEFEITLLVNEKLKSLVSLRTLFLKDVTSEENTLLEKTYDVSVNLSLSESSWTFHQQVSSNHRIGPYLRNEELVIEDLWSSYLLTLKEKNPFLTFHLKDIYRNILGLKNTYKLATNYAPIKKIFLGTMASHVFPVTEQEKFIQLIAKKFKGILLHDISEAEDEENDFKNSIYIGPATLKSLKICEKGTRGIFLSSGFYGHNLIPYYGNHYIISSTGKKFDAEKATDIIFNLLNEKTITNPDYAIYSIDHESFNGSYLKLNGAPDTSYIFYQSHVILWAFLLNLSDINLEPLYFNKEQINQVKSQLNALEKIIRLYDYLMVSIDVIHQSAKNKNSDPFLISGHLKNLKEVEVILNGISGMNSFIRPILDFYRIRRSQNFGNNLFEQSQNSYLNYAEEHQALKAMHELLNSALRNNEAYFPESKILDCNDVKLR